MCILCAGGGRPGWDTNLSMKKNKHHKVWRFWVQSPESPHLSGPHTLRILIFPWSDSSSQNGLSVPGNLSVVWYGCVMTFGPRRVSGYESLITACDALHTFLLIIEASYYSHLCVTWVMHCKIELVMFICYWIVYTSNYYPQVMLAIIFMAFRLLHWRTASDYCRI